MKLLSLKLANFRGYYGEQALTFSTDTRNNVTVINGNTGEGKTSLLTALIWCLYGGENYLAVDLVNKRAVMEAHEGSTVQASVELTFAHQSIKYTVARHLDVRVRANHRIDPANNSNVSMFKIKVDGSFEKIQNPSGVIESILPQSVSSYFFFDGEKIDEFAKPNQEAEVRESVRNVLKIEVLDRARTHLRAVAKEYTNELAREATPEQHSLLEEQKAKETELETEQVNLQNLKKEQSAGRAILETISEQLGKLEDAREAEENRKQIQGVLQAREEERDRLWLSIRSNVNEGGFLPLVSEAVESAIAILDQKRERGEIPPGIREQFLKDILEGKRCICGRDVKEHSAEHDRITRLLAKTFSTELETTVINAAGNMRALHTRLFGIPVTIREAIKQRVELDEKIEELTQVLDEISSKIQAHPHEDVAALGKKRQETDQHLGAISTKIELTNEKIERLHAELEQLRAKLNRLDLKQKKATQLQQKMSVAYKAADAVDSICEAFAADMRNRIQEQAKQIFKKLVWKDSQFPDISLNEDYHLEVLDRWEMPARRDLSAGERQLLSLAFISGLSRVTEEEAPLVIDTPLGRLSSEPRANIAKYLPEITSQLVLLVTDEELHGKARENIESCIGREYRLVFDQKTGSTSISQLR